MSSRFLLLSLLLTILTPIPVLPIDNETEGDTPVDEAKNGSPSDDMPYWYKIGHPGFLSLAYSEEDEPSGESIRGLTFAWGLWDESTHYMGGVSLWASYIQGDRQTITRLGLEVLGPFTLPLGPVRVILPTISLGLDHRDEEPDDGLGAFATLGAELALWFGPHWQVGLRTARVFEFGGGDRTQASVHLRWMSKKFQRQPP